MVCASAGNWARIQSRSRGAMLCSFYSAECVVTSLRSTHYALLCILFEMPIAECQISRLALPARTPAAAQVWYQARRLWRPPGGGVDPKALVARPRYKPAVGVLRA